MIWGRSRLILCFLRAASIQGKPQCEGRTSTSLALDRHAPAVQFGNLSYERESQACTRRIGIFYTGDAEKLFKNVRAILKRNTLPMIGHRDKNVAVSGFHKNRDIRIDWAVFDRVGDEVRQRASQQIRVYQNGW